jgi:thiamine biosynthesis lipoprotein
MGMPVSIHLRGPDLHSRRVVDAVTSAFAELRQADLRFSPYRPDSEVSRIRDGRLAPADGSPPLREVTALCAEAADRTDGWFDAHPTGPDGRAWFDPTGLVKGWAVERAAVVLAAALPSHDRSVNAGGDVLVDRVRPENPPWAVGVEDPADRSRLVAVVHLDRGGVATSGTAARGPHIRNPRTGRPATELRSVTVVGPSLMWADVHATAAFARGADAVTGLSGLADHRWVVVDRHGRVVISHPEPGVFPGNLQQRPAHWGGG